MSNIVERVKARIADHELTLLLSDREMFEELVSRLEQMEASRDGWKADHDREAQNNVDKAETIEQLEGQMLKQAECLNLIRHEAEERSDYDWVFGPLRTMLA